LSATAVAVIVVVGAVMWFGDSGEAGYRIRAETLVPAQLSVRPDDVACPDGAAPSPIEHLGTGVLADTLPVYDGDLVVVRMVVGRSDDVDSPIRFAARWPTSVVGSEPPACVFVVGPDPAASSEFEWEPASGGIEASVAPGRAGTSTEVEVWLVADDPDPGATFRTTIVPEDSGDEVVVDPVGGRVTVDRRPGSAPDVSVVAEPLEPGGRDFRVVATVSNSTPRTRALDVMLRLETTGSQQWMVESPDLDDSCFTGNDVECSLGDLAAGEVVDVVATFTQPESWAPSAVACQHPPADVGFGVCVDAGVESSGDAATTSSSTSVLVELPRPTESGLLVATDPNSVIARAGIPVEFAFTIGAAQNDLGSLNVVGSDCNELGREVEEALDDGDAFLEAGETWRYRCQADVDESTTFRIDVAAVDGDGNAVSNSFETTIRVIDPSLQLTRGTTNGSVVVSNSGSGTIRDVAISIPRCQVVDLLDGQPALLEEDASVEFACAAPAVVRSGAVAYGTDELGFGVVGTFGR